jgi:replication factor A1
VEKAEEQADVPQVRYNFTSIADLNSVEKDSVIDTIGVLKEVSEMQEITSKTTGKPYAKRELTLVDNTNFSVRLTIWGAGASSFDVQPDSVIAFKGVKVSDFGGRSLSLLSSGSMSVDPDIDQAHKLKGWYDAQGRNDVFNSHANTEAGAGMSGRMDPIKTISQIKDEQLGMSEATDYFTTKATITYIKQENVAYPACLKDGCNKKVVEVDGVWRCERCDISHPKPEWRYIMSLNVSDHTGQIWLSCFDDVGRMIMGMTADKVMELKENDEKEAGDVFQSANCQTFTFKCRAKMDNFQDQQRLVTSCEM